MSLPGEPLTEVPPPPDGLQAEGKRRWKATATALISRGMLREQFLDALLML